LAKEMKGFYYKVIEALKKLLNAGASHPRSTGRRGNHARRR
jgi:hypothetical protein